MAIPQIKFGFFLAFKQSFWPFSGIFLSLFNFLLKFAKEATRSIILITYLKITSNWEFLRVIQIEITRLYVKNGKEAAFKLNNCTLLKSLFSPRSFF